MTFPVGKVHLDERHHQQSRFSSGMIYFFLISKLSILDKIIQDICSAQKVIIQRFIT